MRTIRTKVFLFNELNEDGKEKAIEKYRSGNDGDMQFCYDEASKSVEEFHAHFKTSEGRNSWLDIRTGQIDDNVLNLKGVRLRTYIINNYYSLLYDRKPLGKWPYKRYSKCQLVEDCCPFTGVCYDEDLLYPIRQFIKEGHKKDSFSYLTYEMLLTDCIESLARTLESEEEYRNSDEYIIEEIENRDYEFTADGRRI